MRILLIALFLLGSVTTFASVLKIERISIQNLKELNPGEQKIELSELYSVHDLDPNKSYLLINLNSHPGLVCSTSVNLSSLQTEEDPTFEHNDSVGHNTLVLSLTAEDLNRVNVVFTACTTTPYISVGNLAQTDLGDELWAISQSLIISKNDITKPEINNWSKKSRKGGFNTQVYDLRK